MDENKPKFSNRALKSILFDVLGGEAAPAAQPPAATPALTEAQIRAQAIAFQQAIEEAHLDRSLRPENIRTACPELCALFERLMRP